MIERFPFVRAAVHRPWYFYFQALLSVSPLQLVGLLFGAMIALHGLGRLRRPEGGSLLTNLAVFSSWSWAYLAGLTLVGIAGGGYQTRFLLPALPCSSIFASLAIDQLSAFSHRSASSTGSTIACMVQVLETLLLGALGYSAILAVYYGVLYPPLFSDLEYGLGDILRTILSSPLSSPSSRDVSHEIADFIHHFGLIRRP